MPFDAYAWVLTDPETTVGSAPLAAVPALAELPELIRLRYCTAVNRWTTLGDDPVALLAEVTGGRLDRSLLWRELLCRYDVADVASVVFRDRFGCWAFLELWRTGRAPFGPDDAALLREVVAPITTALRRSQARTFAAAVDRLRRPVRWSCCSRPDLAVGAADTRDGGPAPDPGAAGRRRADRPRRGLQRRGAAPGGGVRRGRARAAGAGAPGRRAVAHPARRPAGGGGRRRATSPSPSSSAPRRTGWRCSRAAPGSARASRSCSAASPRATTPARWPPGCSCPRTRCRTT